MLYLFLNINFYITYEIYLIYLITFNKNEIKYFNNNFENKSINKYQFLFLYLKH